MSDKGDEEGELSEVVSEQMNAHPSEDESEPSKDEYSNE